MKRTLFAAVAALCLAACNSDSGPERTTPAEFGEVTFSPAEVASDTEVAVEAFITSEYGFRRVDIVYFFDDDESYVLFASPMRSFDAETKALTYKGIIPGQKAGRKVTSGCAPSRLTTWSPTPIPGRTRFPTERGMKKTNNPINNKK